MYFDWIFRLHSHANKSNSFDWMCKTGVMLHSPRNPVEIAKPEPGTCSTRLACCDARQHSYRMATGQVISVCPLLAKPRLGEPDFIPPAGRWSFPPSQST